MPHDTPPARRLLLAAGLLATAAAGGLAAYNLFAGTRVPVDFPAFWAAGRLAAEGKNPYDPTAVLTLQRAAGVRSDVAVMMWNPPWALPIVAPFGLLPFAPAYGCWALAQIGLVVGAVRLLWRSLAPGPAPHPWVAYPLALLWVPTAYLVGIGQLTGVVLFGLAGFAAATRRGRPVLAGVAAGLTAVKPHLLILFAVWLLLEAVARREGRRVVIGGAVTAAVAAATATALAPGAWAGYARATTAPGGEHHYGLENWMPPVVGGWVRAAVPGQPFWVQLAFPVTAAAAVVVWYVASRAWARPPDWTGRLPVLVGLSLLVAPYGAWPFDLVLLLVPVVAVAVRVAAAPTRVATAVGLGWLAAVNAGLLAMMLQGVSSEWYVWAAPAVLTGCLVVRRLTPSATPGAPGEATVPPRPS